VNDLPPMKIATNMALWWCPQWWLISLKVAGLTIMRHQWTASSKWGSWCHKGELRVGRWGSWTDIYFCSMEQETDRFKYKLTMQEKLGHFSHFA